MDELLTVQNLSYDRPTILVARRVSGEEEIPDGTVAVLTSDMPDVLSHVSVRARNSKVIAYYIVLVCLKLGWLSVELCMLLMTGLLCHMF